MNKQPKSKKLSAGEAADLLKALKARFEKNMNRHKGLDWAKVETRLKARSDKLWSLGEMERTGRRTRCGQS